MKTTNQEMRPLHDVSPQDAIGMLIADHLRVANLFADFKRATDEGRDKDKAAIVEKICRELTIHTQLEEEVFYPAARKAIDDSDQMDEAVVEHAGAKQLIAQLQGVAPSEDLYDAKVTVLAEQIYHHVDEEEGSMFPKVRYSGLDTLKLGAAMAARKSELMSRASGRETVSVRIAAADHVAPNDRGTKKTGKLPHVSAKKKSPAQRSAAASRKPRR